MNNNKYQDEINKLNKMLDKLFEDKRIKHIYDKYYNDKDKKK